METVSDWNERPEVIGARLADSDMGAENRRIVGFGPCPGVEFVTLEGIVQPFPLHFHDFWTIGQMVAGTRRMYCRGQVHLLGPEDFVLFGPGEVHGCEPVGSEALMYRSVVVPDDVFVQAFCETSGQAAPAPGRELACRFASVVARDTVLSACMARLYALGSVGLPADPLEEEEALFALVARAVRYCEAAAGRQTAATSAPSAAADAVARARAYIDREYASSVSLADLAQAAGASRYHLIRVFSDETGLTPHRYLQAVRANRARDLLAAGVDPAEAAVRSGFSDQAHMGRVYKSFYGITPGRYRAAALGRSEGGR